MAEVVDDVITTTPDRALVGESGWRIAARRLRRNQLALAGLGLLLVLGLTALLAPWIAPYDPTAQGDLVGMGYQAPSAKHCLGTDQCGRAVFSRLSYGAGGALELAVPW